MCDLGVLPAACILAVLAMLVVGERLRPESKRLATWLPLPFLLFSGITGLYAYFSAWDGNACSERRLQCPLRSKPRTFSRSPCRNQVAGCCRSGRSTQFPVMKRMPRTTSKNSSRANPSLAPISKTPRMMLQRNCASATAGQSYVHVASWIESPMDPAGAFVLTDWKGLTQLLAGQAWRSAHGQLHRRQHRRNHLQASSGSRLRDCHQLRAGRRVIWREGKADRTWLMDIPQSSQVRQPLPWRRNGFPLATRHGSLLSWQAQQPVANDQLKVSLFLTDEKGHLAGQVDDSLAGDLYLFEETWQPGQIGNTYHILPTLPGIPPGRYKLYAAVYESQTMKRLPAAGAGIPAASAALLGSIEVTRAITTPVIQPQIALTADIFPTAAIGLKGYDLPTSSFNPGDTVPLTLFWQAKTAPGEDYTTTVRLQTTEGKTVSESVEPPGGAQFPTTLWPSGEIVRSWQDVVIPPTTPAGTYQLVASLSTAGRPLERPHPGPNRSGRPAAKLHGPQPSTSHASHAWQQHRLPRLHAAGRQRSGRRNGTPDPSLAGAGSDEPVLCGVCPRARA